MGPVLVVDDSRTVREVHRQALATAGYTVVTAEDGLDALARLSIDGSIALVVTDLDMGSLDGFALTEAIRAQATRSALPIVVVTSKESDADRKRALEAGANAYIVKQGLSWGVLLRTVMHLLGDHGLRPDLSMVA
jgi:two-component system, chemotaxis family, sensor kinase CheA